MISLISIQQLNTGMTTNRRFCIYYAVGGTRKNCALPVAMIKKGANDLSLEYDEKFEIVSELLADHTSILVFWDYYDKRIIHNRHAYQNDIRSSPGCIECISPSGA